MLKTLEELRKARKDLESVGKKISKLVTERKNLTDLIEEYEKNCHHQMGKRKYIEKLDRFSRKCTLCEKETLARE